MLEPLVYQLWNICFMSWFIVRKMVMLKVISLALLSMIRIRFPVDKSIAHILRSRYGNKLVKEIGKFEKIYYKLQKCKTDIVFLETCLENNIIPNFLNFHVNNLHLKTSRAYSCQMKLLREEISVKKSKVKTFEKDFIVLKRQLRETLGIIDYTHLCCLFLNKNDRKLKHQQGIHSKKPFDLGFENSQTSHALLKLFSIINLVLTESEKRLLCKGLNFAIPPKTLKFADI